MNDLIVKDHVDLVRIIVNNLVVIGVCACSSGCNTPGVEWYDCYNCTCLVWLEKSSLRLRSKDKRVTCETDSGLSTVKDKYFFIKLFRNRHLVVNNK